jgi:membrane protein YdbS with pleckstrin-like domain
MSSATHTAASWVYQGLWGVLSRWFKVPKGPPTIPFHDSTTVESFRPSDGYLRYLKLLYWFFTGFMAAVVAFAWIIAVVAAPIVAIALAPPILIILLTPALASYIALHLRFDSTWYVLTDRSLRIRRGIWTIRETTITFENIQNVVVNQGPLQRFFGIADVVVQTAGGGARKGPHGEDTMGPHAGLLEGLADAPRIRDLVLARLKESKSAGLGDEAHGTDRGPAPASAWTSLHLAVFREIRDLVRALS